MIEEILKYLGIYLLACLKSILPPLLGPAAGLESWEIIIITVVGLMTSVLLFTYLGEKIKKHIIPIFVKQPKSSPRKAGKWLNFGKSME